MRNPIINGVEHRHTAEEMEYKRNIFALWYFDPYKEGSLKEWAETHQVSYQWVLDVRKEPEFISRMENFRKTYREQADEALQNLIRFSHSPEARAAIPAIKILMDVMGYNAPQRLEVTTKGMTLADYLEYVRQDTMKVKVSEPNTPALVSENPLEGEFSADPWETEIETAEEVAA